MNRLFQIFVVLAVFSPNLVSGQRAVATSDVLVASDWYFSYFQNGSSEPQLYATPLFIYRFKPDGTAFAIKTINAKWKDITFGKEGISKFQYAYAGSCYLKRRKMTSKEKKYYGVPAASNSQYDFLDFSLKKIRESVPPKLEPTQVYAPVDRQRFDRLVTNNVHHAQYMVTKFIDPSRSTKTMLSFAASNRSAIHREFFRVSNNRFGAIDQIEEFYNYQQKTTGRGNGAPSRGTTGRGNGAPSRGTTGRDAVADRAVDISSALAKKDWRRVLNLDPQNKEALRLEQAAFKGHARLVHSVAFSPDGRRIVSGSGDNTLRIWDVISGQELQTLQGHTGVVSSVAFSSDGTRIVSGSWDATVRIWDAISGQQLKKLQGHSSYVSSVTFSPDGRRIVSGSTDNTLRIWDVISGLQLKKLRGHTSSVYSVAFSPDSKWIVSGGVDETTRIWDANSGQQLQALDGHTDAVYSVAFSPDGKRIVSGSGDKTVKVWDANSGQELQTLQGHTSSVYSVAFSPDGKRIVSGSGDKTVKVWDANSGKQLKKLQGHTSSVYSVAFSPAGTRLASGSEDGTLRIWDVSE